MFAHKECINSLKYLAKISNHENATHCQRLDICSRELGFNNFHHFKHTLTNLLTDRFGKVSLKLMRKYCEATKPKLDVAYYEFYAAKGPKTAQIAFYCHWIGWV